MFKPIRRVITSVSLLVTTGLLVLLANVLKKPFFSFYTGFSKKCVGFLAGVTGVLPFALWEVLAALLRLWFFVSLFLAIIHGRMVRWLSGLLLAVSLGAFLFVGLWGLNYFAPPMAQRLGLSQTQYTREELTEAAKYYLARANEYAVQVDRDEQGVMRAPSLSDAAEEAKESYKRLSETTEGFDGSTARVKPLLTSRLMGATGTTGIFICLTGESCVSSTVFSASLPFTVCHEIGHRMAFAREDEANFAGFLACSASDDPAFLYSGYYAAFTYCYNALYELDPSYARALDGACCKELLADFGAASAHYEQVEDKTAVKVSDTVYDAYLKGFQVSSGVRSYGEVTDLLLAWYFERVK